MASSGDIRAGRAAVELYVDNAELNKGLKNAEQSIKNVDKNLGAMRAGMVVNQLAVGLQDATTVYEQTQNFGRSLMAAYNNLVQVMSMINPMAGAITAAAIAAYQLYGVFSKTAQAAKETAKALKESEETQKRLSKAGKEVQSGEYGPEQSRDLMEGIETRSDARDKIRELRAKQRAAMEAKADRDAITQKLRIEAIENGDAFSKGKRDASAEKGYALDEEIAKIDKQVADLEGRMGNLPFFSKDEMGDIGKTIAAANAETEQANARRAEEVRNEAEREERQRQSEVDSTTQMFETPAERRARLSAEYQRLRSGSIFGMPTISEDTYNRAMASLDQKSTSVVGTFSGAALGGLSASSPLVAIQRATEETAKNTRRKTKGSTFD